MIIMSTLSLAHKIHWHNKRHCSFFDLIHFHTLLLGKRFSYCTKYWHVDSNGSDYVVGFYFYVYQTVAYPLPALTVCECVHTNNLVGYLLACFLIFICLLCTAFMQFAFYCADTQCKCANERTQPFSRRVLLCVLFSIPFIIIYLQISFILWHTWSIRLA